VKNVGELMLQSMDYRGHGHFSFRLLHVSTNVSPYILSLVSVHAFIMRLTRRLTSCFIPFHCFTRRRLLFCLPCFLHRFSLQVSGIFIKGQTVYKRGYLGRLFLSLHFVIAHLIYKVSSSAFLQTHLSSDC
jgi:hypothetical protein